MSRDSQSDSSRTGSMGRGEMGPMIDPKPMSLAEEKELYPDSPGTGNDHAGLTTAVHRANHRRD